MKFLPTPLSALFAIGISTANASYPPEIGESEKEVLLRFGQPQSSLETSNLKVLNFDSYSIRLQNGRVASVAPITHLVQTPEQIQAKRLEIAKRQYKRYSNSSHVIQLSPQARLDFWKRFQSTHPQINVSNEISLAKTDWTTELSAKRLQQYSINVPIPTQAEPRSQPTYKKRKKRSYTHSYFCSQLKTEQKHSSKKKNKKATVVRFSPERGLSAITGVEPILTKKNKHLF